MGVLVEAVVTKEAPAAGRERPEQWWFRRLLGYLAPHRRTLVWAFVCALVSMAATAALPLVIKATVDRAVIGDDDPLWGWLAALLAVGGVRAFFAYARRFAASRIGYEIEHDLRNQIFAHLQRLDFARHDQLETGQLVSRTNGDLTLVYEVLIWTPLMSSNILLFVISFFLMFGLSPLLSMVMLFTIPALLYGGFRMSKVVYPTSWDALARSAEVAGVVEESVTGVRVVKGFGQEQRELGRLMTIASQLFGSRMRNARVNARYGPALNAIPALGQLAILAGGGWLVIKGRLTIGAFLAFQSYLLQMIWPVRMLGQVLMQAQQARAAADRIFEVLDSTPVVNERPGARSLERVEGHLQLDHVTFGYQSSQPVLRELTLAVEPGERVALVGASGSGKSTIALLLPRFYDVQQGGVLVDGVDVRDLTLESLRRRVGVVFEEAFLFSDTIRANIAYGRPEATHEEVVAAARAAEADRFISDLPEGYDTVVGERGLTLSGGQRQRIALARALLTDPEILVLDDATSSIDVRVEDEIHKTLRRLMEGRTTLLIAHRRSTLDLASRIVVLDAGQVIDTGTHDELMSRCRRYRELLAGPDDQLADLDEVPRVRTTEAWPEVEEDELPGAARMQGEALDDVLLEGLRRMPPIVDEPDVDLQRQATDRSPFTLRRFLRPWTGAMLIGLGLVAADALVNLAGPAIIRRGVDHGISQSSTGELLTASLMFLATIAASVLTFRLVVIQTSRTAQRLLLALRVRVFAHLQRLGLDYYEREMAGRVMTRMTSDIDALQMLLQQGLINALASGVTLVGASAILVAMNPRLAAATLTAVVPLVALTRWFQKHSDSAFLDARDKIATVNAGFQEAVSGVRVAQAYVREARNTEEFARLTGELRDARFKAAWYGSVYFPSIELLSTLATAIVLGYGAALIAGGSLTTGALVAFVLYLGQVFWPIQNLSQVFETYQQARAAVTRLRELLEAPVAVPEPDQPEPVGDLVGAIGFEGVRFAYTADGAEALTGVDVDIPAGQTVALVGETGAGKSTFVKLVARFYDPTAGAVLVDGRALTALHPSDYRQRLGYVPQEAHLFSGTIRDNIAYGRPDAPDEEVEAAARAVGAHEFIAALPLGYHTPVLERGRSLSAGQRQLIALARALLVDPTILLLDEATANLDLATEARVAAAMGLVSHGRTTLLIAHRLQTAQRADRILVIDHGHVVEDGPPAELVAAGGRYAELWSAWSAGEPEPEPA